MRRLIAWCLLLSLGLAVGPAAAQRLVQLPSVVRGALTDDDERLLMGERYDEYRIVKRGDRERLVVRFLSAGFRPRLLIRGPDGRLFDEDDIVEGNRRGEFQAFLEQDGVYRLYLASRSRDARGRYVARISLEMPEGPPPPPPAQRLDSVPLASRAVAITLPCLANRTLTYGQIYDRLQRLLSNRQYATNWFLTPSGFAISTSFERITDGGATIAQDRFSTAPFFNSAWQVLLGQTRPGRYRGFIIAYGTGLRQQPTALSLPRIEQLTEPAGFILPQAVRGLRGGPNHYLQIFVYEYRRPSINAPAELVRNGLQAEEHLRGSGLGPALRAICGG